MNRKKVFKSVSDRKILKNFVLIYEAKCVIILNCIGYSVSNPLSWDVQQYTYFKREVKGFAEHQISKKAR